MKSDKSPETDAAPRDADAPGCRPAAGFFGCRLPTDPGLAAQGWEWRCNSDGARLDEVISFYRELGFEVRAEPDALEGLSENCLGCKDSLSKSTSVFVRRAE